eukprot:TRINITY_DN326_c0_g1_i2.p1 TRINITY_DN326_c0_g1~~TRINITY_DN326_c0_g1_i2.p1  ORF type:complete len:260 (-),score=47.66 TRINITY_DN326_c0_g1_i2:97-876(-)
MSALALSQLSLEQVQSFRRDGFLIVKGKDIWSSETVNQLQSWTDDISSWPETPGKWMSYFSKSVKDDSRLFHRIENFFPYHNGYNEIFNGPGFLSLIGQLFGEESLLYKEKINFKYPGGESFKPHQDHAAGWWMYGHSLHISVLVSIDAANKENGCLEVVAGKHKEGLLSDKFTELPEDLCKSLDWISVETDPGDLVFFDSFVPHRSDANLSNDKRRVLYATYNKKSEGDYREQYYADKRKSFPPDCERKGDQHYEYKI